MHKLLGYCARYSLALTTSVKYRLTEFSFTLVELAEWDLNLMHISHVNVYLSSMEYFPSINAVMYGIFGTSPPTRACVAVDLHSTYRVCLDIIAHSNIDRQNRQSLHVQSLSYWAPANIGPYSQSVTVRDVASTQLLRNMLMCA